MAGFLISASLDLWGYLRLEKRTIASVHRWKVIEKSSSQFALRASYSFEFQGKSYRGKTTFSKPYHLNHLSAEKQIKSYNSQIWPVWYQSSHPDHSSLDRVFPLKKCLYTLTALGIFFYFVYLKQTYSSSFSIS